MRKRINLSVLSGLLLPLFVAALVSHCGSSQADGPSVADDASTEAGTETSETGTSQAGPREGETDGGAPDAGHVEPRGIPVPGCADAADPSLTASEKTLLNMPADSWLSAPNSKLYDTCKSAAKYGDGVYLIGGCATIVGAWGGGALDTQRQKMIVWGGGHADYGGNEVYAFNLKTFAWEQLTTPSRPPFNRDILNDGNPVSRHTYDGVEFIDHRGTVFAWGGSRAADGNATFVTWEFLPDSKSWSNLGPTAPAASPGHGAGLAYDRVSKQVFLHLLGYLGSYDFGSNQWQLLKDLGYAPYSQKYNTWAARTGAVDPEQRLFITLGVGLPVFVYDIDARKVLSMNAPWDNLDTDAPFLGKVAPGLDYDSSTKQLVAWAGGSPYVLDTSAVPYHWSSRSSTGAPPTSTPSGVYGRFRYSPRYNVFVLVNEAKENVWFYKHTPRCGT